MGAEWRVGEYGAEGAGDEVGGIEGGGGEGEVGLG